MSIYGNRCILKYLLLVPLHQEKGDVISVGLDGVCEEFNLELCLKRRINQNLQSKTELAIQDKNLYSLLRHKEILVDGAKVDHLLVAELNLTVWL